MFQGCLIHTDSLIFSNTFLCNFLVFDHWLVALAFIRNFNFFQKFCLLLFIQLNLECVAHLSVEHLISIQFVATLKIFLLFFSLILSLSNLNLTEHQLEAYMLRKLITSPKFILSNKQLFFPNDDTEKIPKNQHLAPNNFHDIENTTKHKQLYIHLNISFISYHIYDPVSLISNCKTKSISESRMRTSRTPFKYQYYIYEYTPIESSKGSTLLYIDE